jgi:hypothetical protein
VKNLVGKALHPSLTHLLMADVWSACNCRDKCEEDCITPDDGMVASRRDLTVLVCYSLRPLSFTFVRGKKLESFQKFTLDLGGL